MTLPPPETRATRRAALRDVLRGLAGLGLASLGPVHAAEPARDAGVYRESDRPEASPRWQQVRASLWGERPIRTLEPGAAELSLSAPRRADDPAFVPLALRSGLAPAGPQGIRRLTLVIDNNPSPIAAVFDLPADGALPQIETRVRVDDYSFVRVIAESADGTLRMAVRHVKSSGGCSAPPGGDEAAMRAAMGRMQFRSADPVVDGQPLALQWMVSHPNHSGMAMDPLTRHFTPAQFVRSARIWQGERLLLSADLDFAISENPTLRLVFAPQGGAPLRAEVGDTQGLAWQGSSALAALR
ncbi:quinoprotein dehydrogenase-associated SoxYZ-like carrier [Leptothrix discophora]|uniref:Quinoprotein dehydrogenase-associated SoxYZ-like carrier n=1 Tax=Leptothrix discophora TaxID=89 RepID=A0ABT9G982_LEPDI|nr:quinoprotein dehydrogenase-associated SoxYZ-like carrier [Leptothrix discophora]MDP4302763.1 quinoprotein dehydrogenase-associated SoxYZ-like carrier [Leptothrix discophora]